MQRCFVILLAAGLLTTASGSPVAAQKKKKREDRKKRRASSAVEATQHLRLLKDTSEEPIALQTSVVRYQIGKRNERRTVDLIGAVHVGEAGYYEKLNELFKEYDVVLYELVAPTGTRPTRRQVKQSAGGNPVSMLQGMTQDMLQLQSQLELVDYSPKNFVHADMSPEQIAARMKERGDTGFTIALSAFSDIMREANKQAEKGTAQDVNPFELLMSFNDPRKMKKMMAEQFVSTGTLDSGLGETLNRMLINDRNAEAMKVLKRELDKGKKKIGIFYGAAHMKDFEERLKKDYKAKKTEQTWLTAWDLNSGSKKKAEDPFEALLQLLNDAGE